MLFQKVWIVDGKEVDRNGTPIPENKPNIGERYNLFDPENPNEFNPRWKIGVAALIFAGLAIVATPKVVGLIQHGYKPPSHETPMPGTTPTTMSQEARDCAEAKLVLDPSDFGDANSYLLAQGHQYAAKLACQASKDANPEPALIGQSAVTLPPQG